MSTIINADTSDGLKFTSDTSGEIKLQSAGTDTVTVDTSGNVGIGTTSPLAYENKFLEISDSSSASLKLTNSSGLNNGATVAYIASDDSLRIATYETGSIIKFYTEASERMRIDSNGDLAIGTTTAGARLQIRGEGSTSSTVALRVDDSGGNLMFYVRNDGRIYTGTTAGSPFNLTTSSAANMHVNASGILFRSTSSLKYKTDVQDATHGLDDVMNLRAVTYKGKSEDDGDKVFGGLIAEEVHDAGLTEFVQYDEDGNPDALAYGHMVSLAFKAIQELKTENDTLKSHLSALETRIQALENA